MSAILYNFQKSQGSLRKLHYPVRSERQQNNFRDSWECTETAKGILYFSDYYVRSVSTQKASIYNALLIEHLWLDNEKPQY